MLKTRLVLNVINYQKIAIKVIEKGVQEETDSIKRIKRVKKTRRDKIY